MNLQLVISLKINTLKLFKVLEGHYCTVLFFESAVLKLDAMYL